MTFLAILIGLTPSFLLVGLGGLLRDRLSVNAWQGLDKLNFEILFPALLFVAASTRQIEPAAVVTIAPAVWAVLALGLAVGWLAPLRMLAEAAIPIALISVGATMNWGALARLNMFSGILCATKLIVLPAAVVAVALVMGWSGPVVVAVAIWAALPTASAAHVLAAGFGADRELSATLVAQTTLLGALSLPVWIAVAEAVLAA